MSDTKMLIEATSLSKRFAGHTVLEGVDFSIAPEEVVTLVGLNGCGKTTLLRILLKLDQPDSGAVHHKKGLSIGYMPQRFEVDPALPMTVKAFLRLSTHNRDVFKRCVAETKVEELLNRQLGTLSGGETQRVLLARAMMREPDILVLDEPVQGVDMSGQTELYQLITKLSKEHKCAVLMVSHDLHLVMASTDQVLCLNRHICCSGHPNQVSKDPAFVKLFGDQAARTLALYEHNHDHAHDMQGRVVEDGHSCGHDHSHEGGEQ